MELDNPVWWALQGPARSLGAVRNGAARFLPEVSPFGGFEAQPGPTDWDDLAHLTGPGSSVAVIATEPERYRPPDGWTASWASPGVQMVGGAAWVGRSGPGPHRSVADPVVSLGPDDVGDMLALVAESRPGPFSSRTVEFGGYVGVRRHGRLVAMAGERLRPPGYAEISAVTTHPDHRRQGLAELLVGTVGAGITARGEVPFLHVAAGNLDAIRLYEAMGFTVRRTVWFTVFEVTAG